MSCIEIPDPHRQILDLLLKGPRRQTNLPETTGTDLTGPVAELRSWGWVFGDRWVELTGAGHYHAGTVVGGLVGRTGRLG